ncbi:MAG: hypothetical protein HYY06_13400 [Deltaproteobacteria bacterium]|nr:hypothetical protein [Deltaproteobacteria bacterium]
MVRLAAFCLAFAGCSRAPDPSRELSDEELREIARRPIEESEVNQVDVIVGRHRGTPVRMTVRCGDLCPDYSVRIVRYDVDPATCPRVGGSIVRMGVPSAASVSLVDMCLPAPIAAEQPTRWTR